MIKQVEFFYTETGRSAPKPEFHLHNLKCDLHLDFLVSSLLCLHEAILNAAFLGRR